MYGSIFAVYASIKNSPVKLRLAGMRRFGTPLNLS